MRLENLKVEMAFVIPFGHPDKNGVVYSKEAVEKAISSFNGKEIPIIYRGNDVSEYATVIGNTVGETCSVLWDDEHQVCEVIINGDVYYGGTECVVNETKNGVITDFDIVSVGFSQR